MTILDGNKTAALIREELAEKVKQRVANGLKVPHLVAVLVGNDGASQTYVAAKVKDCEDVGFKSTLIKLSENATEGELLDIIFELNQDPNVDGYIVQLPLPKHISEPKILMNIDPNKDVDGFHPQNVGKMALGLPCFISATPLGIIELLKRYNVPTEGKKCVIIGRSNIVGKPMSVLMARNSYPGNCTVTVVHSRSTNIKEICLQADILIAALGKPEFVTADMVKQGATVIDVGITRLSDTTKTKGYRLVGDVKYDEVADKCTFITPVPGGVGPMTRAALLLNTMLAVAFQTSEN